MQKLLVANYKMNGNQNFYKKVNKQINKLKSKDTVILCPPFVYMPILKINNKFVEIGSQDVAHEFNNKSTGEVSADMLKEFEVKYSIVGHSERRNVGETNEMVAKKVKHCVDNNICPIICVGEKTKRSSTLIIKKQLLSSISKVNKSAKLIFAYEPVWAIGSGEVPTNHKINKIIQSIKQTLKENGFTNVKVLYGGSVNETNYKELLQTCADGFLLGGVSLKLDKLETLIKGVHNE